MCISLNNFQTSITAIKYVLCVSVCSALTLPMGAHGNTLWWFAGPMGCVSLDVEGVTGGRLQIPDVLLQCQLTDSLLIFHLHWVWGTEWSEGGEEVREDEVRKERSERQKWVRHESSGIRGGAVIKVVGNKNKRGNNKYNLFLPSFYGYCPFH